MDKKIKKFIRTGLLLGLGVASVTRDKVDKLAKKVIKATKQQNISEKEGRKVLNDFLKKSRTEQKRVENIMGSALKQITKPYVKKVKKKR